MAQPGQELPEGWTEHSLAGKTFYFHKASNTTQEERPKAPEAPATPEASPTNQALRAAEESASASAPPEQPAVPQPAAPQPAAAQQEPAPTAQLATMQPQGASAAAQPETPMRAEQLQVVVPAPGLNAGQQLAFTAPASHGQPPRPMTVTASESVAPGSVMTVQYLLPQQFQENTAPVSPMPPQPEVNADEVADLRSAKRSWRLFSMGCCCLFISVPFAVLAFMWAACWYYCMPAQQRALRPRQRKPALYSLVLSLSVPALLGTIAIIHGHHHHPRPSVDHHGHMTMWMGEHEDMMMAAHHGNHHGHFDGNNESPHGHHHGRFHGHNESHHGHHHGHFHGDWMEEHHKHHHGHHDGLEGESEGHHHAHHHGRHEEEPELDIEEFVKEPGFDGEHNRPPWFFKMRKGMHHLRHHYGEDAANATKPCRFRTWVHSFFKKVHKEEAPTPVRGPALPVGSQGTVDLLHE